MIEKARTDFRSSFFCFGFKFRHASFNFRQVRGCSFGCLLGGVLITREKMYRNVDEVLALVHISREVEQPLQTPRIITSFDQTGV